MQTRVIVVVSLWDAYKQDARLLALRDERTRVIEKTSIWVGVDVEPYR